MGDWERKTQRKREKRKQAGRKSQRHRTVDQGLCSALYLNYRLANMTTGFYYYSESLINSETTTHSSSTV